MNKQSKKQYLHQQIDINTDNIPVDRWNILGYHYRHNLIRALRSAL